MSETYKNAQQCSAATGTPIKLLEVAALHPTAPRGVSGFHESGRIHWDKLKSWFESNRIEIEEMANESRAEWEIRKVRAVALREETELAALHGKLVEKEKVHAMLRTISAAQCSLLNSKFGQEFAVRVNGKSVAETLKECDTILNDVFSIIQKGISEWR